MDAKTTPEFVAWYQGLSAADFQTVNRLVSLLELNGVTLGYPYSSAIKGSRHALRELRSKSHGRPLRIFYIFDAERDAVLLIGGNKAGDKKFYEREIRNAEQIWERFLAKVAAGE